MGTCIVHTFMGMCGGGGGGYNDDYVDWLQYYYVKKLSHYWNDIGLIMPNIYGNKFHNKD